MKNGYIVYITVCKDAEKTKLNESIKTEKKPLGIVQIDYTA